MHRFRQRLGHGLGRLGRSLRRASRYDLVLAVIPAVLLAAAVLGATLPVPATPLVTVAAGVSALAVADALFLNPPRDPTAGPPRV